MGTTAQSYGSYGSAGLALLTAGAIAVAPVVGTPAGVAVSRAAVQLTSNLADFNWDSLLDPQTWSNIGQNLLIDIANVPANWWTAVNTYANMGLGFPGITGTTVAPGSVPYDYQDPNLPLGQIEQSDPNFDAPGLHDGNLGTTDPVYPYWAPIGPNGEAVPVGIGGTGSWWMESTGNTWGWDEGNFGQVIGLSNMIVPIPQFSTPFAYELQSAAMQNIVANPQACPFECPDLLGYLGGWFHNLGAVLTGDQVPVGLTADGHPISPLGLPISWAGHSVGVKPEFFITSFLNSLIANPDGTSTINNLPVGANTIDMATYQGWLANPSLFFAPFVHIVQNLLNDFNPFVDGSFIYWGAPSLYTVPALVAGLATSLTGGIVGNPFAQYTLAPGGAFTLEPYLGQDIVGENGTPEKVDLNTLFPGIATHDPSYVPLGHVIGPQDLPDTLGAGLLYGLAGLLGYLDPYNYLSTLGVTSATTESELAAILGNSTLAEGIFNLHQGADTSLIGPLQGFADELIPWYHDLTVGAGLDAFSQGADVLP